MPPITLFAISTHRWATCSSHSILLSAVSFPLLGPMPSIACRRTHACRPLAWRRSHDDRRSDLVHLSDHLAAVFCLLLPLADRRLHQGSSFPGSSRGYWNFPHCLSRRLFARVELRNLGPV